MLVKDVTKDINFICTKGGAVLTIRYEDGVQKAAHVNWSTIGASDFETTRARANDMIYLTEFGESMIHMIESNQIQSTVESNIFYNEEFEFLPMESLISGSLGYDIKSKSVKYFEYGELFSCFERREIKGELKLHENDFNVKLAQRRGGKK